MLVWCGEIIVSNFLRGDNKIKIINTNKKELRFHKKTLEKTKSLEY